MKQKNKVICKLVVSLGPNSARNFFKLRP